MNLESPAIRVYIPKSMPADIIEEIDAFINFIVITFIIMTLSFYYKVVKWYTILRVRCRYEYRRYD